MIVPIERIDEIGGFRRVPRTTLRMFDQALLAVAGVDALGAVADEEVFVPAQPGARSSTGMQISSVAPGYTVDS